MPPLSVIARNAVLGFSTLALPAGSGCAASFTYTTLPALSGTDYSSPNAINQNDVVVGSDSSGTTAFFWQNGAATFVSAVPGFYDINASGIATAKDKKAGIRSYSLYNIATGSLQSIKAKTNLGVYPLLINASGLIGADLYKGKEDLQYGSGLIQGQAVSLMEGKGNTIAYITGLNDSGEAIGYYIHVGDRIGVTYLNGTYKYFHQPGASGTTPTFIAPDGTIVGYYRMHDRATSDLGFELTEGKFTTISVPGAAETYPSGIGPNGEIVGYYEDAQMVAHGFVYSGGMYSTIDYPGSSSTVIRGINSLGSIIGVYGDSLGNLNGYIGQCASGQTCTN
jgi:hypothetical protein